MKSRLIGGIAALLLAVVGTALLVIYVKGADARALQGAEPVEVLVVQERVPAGTPVDELSDFLQAEAIPQSAVPEDSLNTLDGQDGKITAADLMPGEQLLAARLVAPEQFSPGTVPVPEGLEEVTILLAPERMLAGRLKAGDLVGVHISGELVEEAPPNDRLPGEMIGFKEYSNLNFQNVLVTAVQQAAPQTEDSANGEDEGVAMPNGSAFVTLALNDFNAGRVIFGAEFGAIWLTKETDTSEEGNPPVITIPEVVK
ncbi:Flp pilus assembly protein CpaB [Arthrobacter zhaoguopingii]|uniref:Flp pilus assembly protein CpaB n=1 Tax=Arthrobacter zhaoguopingii TaxID=2681491 RepID=UPI00135C1985|nr:pilus assembly protein CpaB [Arthrobacter zhaoguopingii]